MVAAYRRRRDLVLALCQEIPGFRTPTPSGAFYVFPDVSNCFGKTTPDGQVIGNASDLAMFMLHDAHVAAVDGGAFGAPNCIRFSTAAADEKLREAFIRIKNSLVKLQ
jgi:aspartate aminotransferase